MVVAGPGPRTVESKQKGRASSFTFLSLFLQCRSCFFAIPHQTHISDKHGFHCLHSNQVPHGHLLN